MRAIRRLVDRSARATATGALALAFAAPVGAAPSWLALPSSTPPSASGPGATSWPSEGSSGVAVAEPAVTPVAPVTSEPRPVPSEPRGVASTAAGLGAEVVMRAMSLLGVGYRWGGNSPETGLDCSGMVRHVFRDALGLVLPRRSEEISRVGGAVGASELQPGDLVFFNTLKRAFSHVGIYIGNGQFVHAPSRGGSIRVEHLDREYWSRRFDGARRLASAGTPGAAGADPSAAASAAVATADEAASLRATSAAAEAVPTSAGPSPVSRSARQAARSARSASPVTARAVAAVAPASASRGTAVRSRGAAGPVRAITVADRRR